MLRRHFLQATAAAVAAAQTRRVNVLMIAVDDLRPQLGCYGHRQIKSPNIDALAARGMRFERAYCQQAVCAPTRVSLLTGTRPDTTRVYDLQTPLNTVRPDLVTLPHHFRNNGYETISLGKIYHHANEDPEGWSARPWRPKANLWADPASLRIADSAANGRGPAYESTSVPDNAYPDGQICDRALQELDRLKGSAFFLAVGFHKPHLPFCAPRKYWDLYSERDLELPTRNEWPEDMPRVAGSNWGELRNYAGMPKDGPVNETTMRKLIHGYYACVSFTDAQVGRLMARLDELRLRENTIVVLWGDHGWKLGEYGSWCKHTNFELDTHVPLILSVPGQKNAGRSTPGFVEYVDVYPTLAEACGLAVPRQCEGRSMMPLVNDPSRRWKTATFSQYPRGGGVMGYSMRTDRWRYTEWIRRDTGEVTARELYDHSKSDVASANLANLPERKGTVEQLSRMLDRGQGWQKVRESL